MIDLKERMADVKKRLKELEEKLSQPGIINNLEEYKSLTKRHQELGGIIQKWEQYEQMEQRYEEAKRLSTAEDEELAELAREEMKTTEKELERLHREVLVSLLPKDPYADKNIIMEIRAGTGGEEAALFAADLYRMYLKYAERQGWETSLISINETSLGGVKEVIFSISGKDVYSKLKYESGTHRVQRVPITEASGRIHTSAATVAVMPD